MCKFTKFTRTILNSLKCCRSRIYCVRFFNRALTKLSPSSVKAALCISGNLVSTLVDQVILVPLTRFTYLIFFKLMRFSQSNQQYHIYRARDYCKKFCKVIKYIQTEDSIRLIRENFILEIQNIPKVMNPTNVGITCKGCDLLCVTCSQILCFI